MNRSLLFTLMTGVALTGSAPAFAEDYAYVMAVQPHLETVTRMAEKCETVSTTRMVPKHEAPIPDGEVPVVDESPKPFKKRATPARKLLSGVSETLREPWTEYVEAELKSQACRQVPVQERQFLGHRVFVRYLSQDFNFLTSTPPQVGQYIRVMFDVNTGEVVPVMMPQAQGR